MLLSLRVFHHSYRMETKTQRLEQDRVQVVEDWLCIL